MFKPRYTAILVVVLSLMLGFFKPAFAQDNCTSVTILNQSTTQLDTQKICEAASKFVAKGHQVYVFVTDKSVGSSEGDWFAQRDTVEIGWGIYDKSADTFSKKAVSIELSTDTSKPWGQDLAFGEMLYGTPLDNDSTISGIEGSLKNKVAAGDVTVAIVDTFNDAYQKGYPPPPPTAAPVTPGPTVIVQGPTTNVQVDFTPVLRVLGGILLFVLCLGLAYGAVVYIVVPAYMQYEKMSKLKNQVKLLRQRLGKLLNTLSGSASSPGLLTGEKPEDTLVYALWAANGGTKYVSKDGDVKESLRRSQVALGKAFDVWTNLAHDENSQTEEVLRQLVADLETLYLTVVGTTERILSMTESEQLSLLDPMTAMPRETTDVQLVAQIDEIVRRQSGAGGLRIELMMAQSKKVDPQGILGYLDQVKAALRELSIARAEGPAALEKAVSTRQEIDKAVDPPEEMGDANPFANPDSLIDAAQKALAEELWLEVKDNADRASAAMRLLPEVVTAYTAAVEANKARRAKLQKLIEQGYQITRTIQSALDEETSDIVDINEAIVAGDFSTASEKVRELEADLERALTLLQALDSLRIKNSAELQRLAREVAKVDNYRLTTAQPSWESLRAYPISNWQSVDGNFDQAGVTLSKLFDKPEDELDLASNIARANSFKVQKFAEAEQMLTQAFSQLNDAESKLKSVVEQLTDVRKVEQAIGAAITAALADLAKAVARRDADDTKIDSVVDEQIQAAESLVKAAQKAMRDREFIVANNNVSKARETASQAYASANEQATAIDSLYKALLSARDAANISVNRALTEYSRLTPAAQKASTGGRTSNAQDMLRSAARAESSIAGQDRALAKSLSQAVDLYRSADKLAREALSMISDDKEEYDTYVSNVQSAINSAERAISSASGYVSDSDAENAGRSSLSRAQSMIPAEPSYGESTDALERRRRQAEDAARMASNAASEAQSRIRENEEARAAERRRQARIREEREEHERQEAAARARYSSSSSSSSGSSSSGYSSSFSNSHSSSSSSFGSSSSSHSSSMGSSGRR